MNEQMDKSPMQDEPLQRIGKLLDDRKATNGMRKCLDSMIEHLTCPLCNELFQNPTTLSSCGHSFCVSCIDSYCCNAWTCPVTGCNMPLSIVGGSGGSYRKVNPQLIQISTSLKLICEKLNEMPDEWWEKSVDTDISNLMNSDSMDTTGEEEELIDLQSEGARRLIDLQANSNESDEEDWRHQ